MRLQLTNRDRAGMTVAMLAAKSSNMAVLGALLAEVLETEVRAGCAVVVSGVRVREGEGKMPPSVSVFILDSKRLVGVLR